MNQTINDLKEGYWEEYCKNGNLLSKRNYINGLRNGYCEEYWLSGDLWYKGNFNSDIKSGYWEYYSSNNLDKQIMFI